MHISVPRLFGPFESLLRRLLTALIRLWQSHSFGRTLVRADWDDQRPERSRFNGVYDRVEERGSHPPNRETRHMHNGCATAVARARHRRQGPPLQCNEIAFV